jgi:hypothetical protein
MQRNPAGLSPEMLRLRDELWARTPRPDFTVEAQIVVETSADVAYDWVDHLTTALARDVRARLAGLPASKKAAGVEPGETYGEIEVTRYPNGRYAPAKARVLSEKGLRWLGNELVDMPHIVRVSVGLLGEDGIVSVGPVSLEIFAPPRSPGWMRLSAYVLESAFVDPGTQRRWLDAVLAFADRANPGYGQIGYHRGSKGSTAVEETADARIADVTRRDPGYAIGRSRQMLRGYDWLTIVPQELATTLGGADALAATGAFAEVRPLGRGGVAVLADSAFQDYDLSVAEPVFRALARVLPPGRPRLILQPPNVPPVFVIDQDPAEL